MTGKEQPGSTFSDLMTYLRANGLPEDEIKQIIPPEHYEEKKEEI
jgi:hypothetical protein